MKRDLISIIVPVYNVKSFIKECINSIIAQTYKNIEILLIDDGSTDGSGEMCDYYSSLDKRIIVVHKDNGGLSDARNCGLRIAKGEFIGFVDSDDWIEPDMYERLYKKIKSGNFDISICGLIREYKNRSILEPLKENSYNRNEAIEKLLRGRELHDHSWSKLYKRDIFNNIRFPKGKYFEDILTTYRTFLQSESVIVESTPLYHYRQRGGSIVRDGINSKRFQLLYAVESISQDRDLVQWNSCLEERRILVKQNIIYDLAVNGSIKEIKHNWERINNYINDIKSFKHNNKEYSDTKLDKFITKFNNLPNYLIFGFLRLKKIRKIKYKYF